MNRHAPGQRGPNRESWPRGGPQSLQRRIAMRFAVANEGETDASGHGAAHDVFAQGLEGMRSMRRIVGPLCRGKRACVLPTLPATDV